MFCIYDENQIKSLFEEHSGWQSIAVDGDSIVDYFGVRIPVRYTEYLSGRVGTRIENPPFPDDSFRASFIEYLAIVESIRDSGRVYQMAEIGASYAPFSAICAKLALRKGVEKVVLRPVEASLSGKESIRRNFTINGLVDESIDMRIILAAVVDKYKDVYFPDVDCTKDNGAAPQDEFSNRDIRGAAIPMSKVRGIPLSFVIASFPFGDPIDLLHIDIQGFEKIALPPIMSVLNERVKRVMLATHSRSIEGKMMDLFHEAGWTLVAEEPCDFKYRKDISVMEGMTVKDGSQYWINELMVR